MQIATENEIMHMDTDQGGRELEFKMAGSQIIWLILFITKNGDRLFMKEGGLSGRRFIVYRV